MVFYHEGHEEQEEKGNIKKDFFSTFVVLVVEINRWSLDPKGF